MGARGIRGSIGFGGFAVSAFVFGFWRRLQQTWRLRGVSVCFWFLAAASADVGVTQDNAKRTKALPNSARSKTKNQGTAKPLG
jgi:hypothetical protein